MFQETKVPGNESSWERKFQEMKVPEDESSTYGTSFPGTKVLEYESSMNPLRGTHF